MLRFSVKTREPIPVEIEGKRYDLPRFTRKDWQGLRRLLDAERLEQAVGHLDPKQAAQLLLLYPLAPLTHAELQRYAYTPDGTGYIFGTACERAGVPKEIVDNVLEGDDTDEVILEYYALLITGQVDPSELSDRLQKRPEGGKAGEQTAPGADSEMFDQSDDPNELQEDQQGDEPEDPDDPLTRTGGDCGISPGTRPGGKTSASVSTETSTRTGTRAKKRTRGSTRR